MFPELLKRFRIKNTKVAHFALIVVTEVFKTRTGIDDLNLKNVFRSIQETLAHQNKELRTLSY